MSTESLVITSEAASSIVHFCRASLPNEAGGFIIGREGIGTRVVSLRNISSSPVDSIRFADEDVIQLFTLADAVGDEVYAVWHSHPTSEPKMSQADVAAAMDPSLAYMIVSMKDDRVASRAYRMSVPFIGTKAIHEVFLQVGDINVPDGPWALTVGNVVKISYVRPGRGEKTMSFVHGTVIGVKDGMLQVDKRKPGSPGLWATPMENVRAVAILEESVLACETRTEMLLNARHLSAALSTGDHTAVSALIGALATAYPPEIPVVEP